VGERREEGFKKVCAIRGGFVDGGQVLRDIAERVYLGGGGVDEDLGDRCGVEVVKVVKERGRG